MLKKLLVVMLALSSVIYPVQAQVDTSRDGFVEDTNLVGKNVTVLEGGYTYFRNDSTRTQTFGEATLRTGLSDNIELRVYGNSYQVTRNAGNRVSGLQDAGVGIKTRLLEGQTSLFRPPIALEIDTTVPTGARVYQLNYQPGATLSFDWNLNQDTALSAALGYRRRDDGVDRYNEVNGGVKLAHLVNDQTSVYGELFDVNAPGGSNKYVGAGSTYLINKDLLLDVRGGYGLNGVNKDFYVGFGATKKF